MKIPPGVLRPVLAAVCAAVRSAAASPESFREEFGCLRCQELVAKNGGKGHCAHMIAWGAQRAEEILAENKVKE